MKSSKLSHPVLRSADLNDDGEEDVLGSDVAEKYAVLGFPTTYWIDHTGKVVGRKVGFDPSHFPAMEKRVEELLAARPTARAAPK